MSDLNKEIIEAILLGSRIARGLNLQGDFYATADSVVLEDSDKNPTVTINPFAKKVIVEQQGDLRDIVLAGVRQYTFDAGYSFREERVEKQLPGPLKKLAEALSGASEPKKDVH